MPSSDGVRHTRGAVFSMEQLIGADAFRLWLTARGVSSIHAGSHQTTRPFRAGNIAVGVKPTDPRDRLAHEERSRPHDARLRRRRGTPLLLLLSPNHLRAFLQTSSWSAPRAGHLKQDTSSRTSQHRTSPSRTTWTRHKKERGTKAPQPKVARREKRAT